MSTGELPSLTEQQRSLLRRWWPDLTVVQDHSWGVVDTRVLHVQDAGADYIVKAAGARNHHIGREITAHETVTAPLADRGRAPRLVRADRVANIVVTEFLHGELVEGSPHEREMETYRQAGELLRTFHAQQRRDDEHFEAQTLAKATALLDTAHRIDADADAAARSVLGAYRPKSTTVVPTHGDWQPRNWLIEDGVVKVIDFGRFAFRPASTDLGRLAVQPWRDDPELETAFLTGYGTDPRDQDFWRVLLVCEAIGTAVWTFHVGDRSFEAQGHRMLAEALAALE